MFMFAAMDRAAVTTAVTQCVFSVSGLMQPLHGTLNTTVFSFTSITIKKLRRHKMRGDWLLSLSAKSLKTKTDGYVLLEPLGNGLIERCRFFHEPAWLNDASGSGVGFLGQLRLYLDDMFPKTFGQPLIGAGSSAPLQLTFEG